eukprot:COSAG05_NODE_5855_length_1072_cov_10.091470_2_plen_153_part_00
MERDLRFEDAGERLDRERYSDPWSGPFLTQSSWEQYKDEAEVSECESRAAATRVVPSAEQLQEELKDYFKKMDEEDLKWEPEPLSADYQACIDMGARIATIEREQGRAAACRAAAQEKRERAPREPHWLRPHSLREAVMLVVARHVDSPESI